jgi:two-component system response regulator HydG
LHQICALPIITCLQYEHTTSWALDGIVGTSAAIARVLEVVRKVAKSQSTVLLCGETGTGKELIAEAVHRNSMRAARTFVKVNCAALQENLLESELFGHEKGAFTGADRQRIGRFEQADGGTLLLDEIGDMSIHTQSKILRVLQEQEFERLGGMRTLRVDIRFIAATHRDLPAMVRAGRFREDLYYRLNVVPIEMPTLRQRREDILPLANSFIRRFATGFNKPLDGLSGEAESLLLRHDWPGNVRELENIIERAVLLTDSRTIGAADLRMAGRVNGVPAAADLVRIPPTGIPLESIEREALLEALKMSNWVPRAAADLLSITPRVMHYKIKALGIEYPLTAKH